MDQFSSHPLYRRHNIDSAMSSLWNFYKKKFLSLFLISLVMALVIQYASTMVNFKELQTIADPLIILEKIKGYIVPMLIISLVNLLFATILQYYIIYNPLSQDNNIFVSALNSLKYFIPYLIILILLAFAGSIAIILGILALVIGVFFSILYIFTLYLFILPIMMVEGPNIGNAISRTITLVHRNFWSNIGWVAVFIIILIVISVIFSSIVLLPFTGSFVKTILNPEDTSKLIDVASNPLFIILSALISALTLPLMPIFACILYFNGKVSEEQGRTITKVNPENDRVRVEDLYAKPYSDDHPENPEKK
ncbi:MAG: glycerophosphoryl diester phosphodiesterase membrane domain-containing protein [Bacteroidia bacterium]|nr:glycerophosphoryl diester phosphodiesterase membrane domain-containing protein [Bacteroidia bacterium]